MTPSNFHTHTHFCDGKNTPEELVLEAIRLGCPKLGFSGHSYTFFDESYCMSQTGTQEYIRQVRALKEKYADRIQILLGVEQDYFSDTSTEGYDYVLGSVHYVLKNGCYLAVDESKEAFVADVQTHYAGDYYSFAEDYFALVADLHRKTGCQILGHFDLVTKFNANGDLFDPNHPRYQAAANKALDALLTAPVTLEVNFGGIAKGHTKSPYPAAGFLARWLRAGKPVQFSSDCHKAENLLFGYDFYENYVENAGKTP